MMRTFICRQTFRLLCRSRGSDLRCTHSDVGNGVRILLVGALSWNPERIRSLAEQGHQLWGLWSRSMGWDQGPYAALDDCVQTITLDDAARTIVEQRIECVYSLFQVYDAPLWDAPSAGVEHDVWTLLRALLAERAAARSTCRSCSTGASTSTISTVPSSGARRPDLLQRRTVDPLDDVNKRGWTWTRALRFLRRRRVSRRRPAQAGVHEYDFSERLSAQTGEIHTVCVGRPFNIDFSRLRDEGSTFTSMGMVSMMSRG